MQTSFWCAVFLFCAIPLTHAEVQQVAEHATPNRIRPEIFVLSAKWTGQIPPTGRVNGPEFFSDLYPGQQMAFGLMAEGPDRDTMFANASVDVRFTAGAGETKEFHHLKPVAVRFLKAEGADLAVMVMESAGIAAGDRAKLEAASSLVTLAVFAPEWNVPASGGATEVEITVSVSGTTLPATITPVRLKIRTTADWLNSPAPSQVDLGRQMTRYHSALAPGQLLSWFQSVAPTQSISAPPVYSFFAFAFKSDGDARTAAIEAYPKLDARAQPPLLWLLRLGGHNLGQLMPQASATATGGLAAVEPLEDPPALLHFQDPIDRAAVSRVGMPMDQCWAAWMATGEKRYLRLLVDLLEGAPDYPALKAWQEAHGGAKGLNARVARRLEYQIAGWSIGSFQRTDPLVMDWLLYWQNDPAVSAVVRHEIANLLTNPAFRRKS